MKAASTSASATESISSRVRRGELLSADCPSREVLKHVTSRWGVLLLMALMDGMHRFSDLHRKVGGVSEKMLAQTLKDLEADGFVSRKVLAAVPPHVEYRLTPLGKQIGKRVTGLTDWIEASLPKIVAARRDREVRIAARGARVIRKVSWFGGLPAR
jgi:DNA-binding HxlR family transcriptional regulator